MKLPSNKIEAAASNQTSRYSLQAVQLDVEKKRIMATDGHIAAIVPCEVEPDDHSALMSLETIKSLRAMQKRSKSIPVSIKTNGQIVADGISEHAEFPVMNGQFPNVDLVIRSVEGPPTISLSVELLYRLAEALHPETIGRSNPGIVSLWIKDANSSIVVKASKSDAVGVIMPCRP